MTYLNEIGIAKTEVKRYQGKGRGAFVAIATIIAFALYWPLFMKVSWDWILTYMDENNVSLYRVYFIAGFV